MDIKVKNVFPTEYDVKKFRVKKSEKDRTLKN